MAQSDELDFTLLDGQQSGGGAIVDAALQTISGGTQGEVDIDCSAGGTIVVTSRQYNDDFTLRLTGTPGAAFTLQVPDGKRVFMVQNVSDGKATVDTTTGSATTIPVEIGMRKIIRSRNFDLEVVSLNIYDLSFWFEGQYLATELLALWVAPRDVKFPVGLPGSAGYAKTDPAAARSFDIQKNGSSVGSVDFALGANTATFTFATETTFAAGDRLEIFAPGTADVDLADVSISLSGLRVE